MESLFYIAAVTALASTVLVVTGKNASHALIYLIVSLLSVAVIFFLLGAPFAAALEVVVYAGAIVVVFLFVVMCFCFYVLQYAFTYPCISWAVALSMETTMALPR